MFTMGPPLRGQAGGDPYIGSVLAGLHFNDANGTTTPSVSIGTPTVANGGTANNKVTTTDPKFGSGCWQATANAGLTLQKTTDAAGPYTFSFWVKPTSFGATFGRFWGVQTVSSGHRFSLSVVAGAVFYLNESATPQATTGVMSLNTWYFISVCYSGGTVTVYLDGVSIYTNSGANAKPLASENVTVNIGQSGGVGGSDGAAAFDDFRWTHGINRFPDVLPPTAAFPDT